MVLVYINSPEGKLKKSAFEAVTYGYKAAQSLDTEVVALTIGNTDNAGILGQYGAVKVLNIAGAENFDSGTYAAIIADAAQQVGANIVVMPDDSTGKALLGRVAVRMDAGAVSGVKTLPDTSAGFVVKKNVFSGKAIVDYNITSDRKVLSIAGNTFPPEVVGSDVAVETPSINVPASRVRIKEVSTVKGTVPLPEAELVVSAGRGVKDPDNWGIIEELANELGATTACSRPVADVGWRPHHEHVGQTGVAIRPNLYIAIGISGAIQHLAGVNQSKTIVVINKDPEAPFFKAADYGIVGDLFDVVPRLNDAIRKFKATS